MTTTLLILPTTSILVEDRQRKKLDNKALRELADSIKNHDLIHPILVAKLDEPKNGKTYRLICGERRFQATLLCGDGEIACTVKEGADPLELQILEYEENICRSKLEWTEEVLAMERIDTLRREQHGDAMQGDSSDAGWGVKDTAACVGLAVSTTSENITLAKKLKNSPELQALVKDMSKSVAKRVISNMEKTEAAEKIRGKLEIKSNLVEGDCITLIKSLVKSESVDLVLTDPPFGVNAIEELRSATDDVIYTKILTDSDNLTEDAVSALLEELIPELYRVTKPGGYLFMFFQFALYKRIVNLLKRAKFTVDDVPLIWDKGRPVSQFKGYRFQTSYEGIICARKDTAKIRLEKPGRNILQFAPIHSSKKAHPFEKPIPLLVKLIETACPKGGLVLDPFAGSGATIEAALRRGRSAIGFDLNPKHIARAMVRLSEVEREMIESKKDTNKKGN